MQNSVQPARTVAAIHDMSGVGRCALTVAIPVISALGAQVCPVPTAVLSAHTAFQGVAVRDLTDFLRTYLEHWRRLDLRFDAVYTGYLASPAQAEIVREFLEDQPQAMKVIDPVMGDGGRMYRGLEASMPARMRGLCGGADLIPPHLTEYALLTGEPYDESPRSEAQAQAMLERLQRETGARAVLITSLPVAGGLANASLTEAGDFDLVRFERLPASFPGTGDLFTSVITGALLAGDSLAAAVRRATEFVRRTIEVTLECGTDPRFGVQLERTLGLLMGERD